MRRIVFAGAILAAASVPAFATSHFDWSGVYVGIHGGFGAGQNTATGTSTGFVPQLMTGPVGVGPFGPLAGVQAGMNGQQGIAVFGVEVDASWAGLTGSGTKPLPNGAPVQSAGMFTASEKINWLATARLRAGLLASDSMLFYVTGGLVAGGVNYAANTSFNHGAPQDPLSFPASANKSKFGWTFGGGGEVVIGDNWTLKAEALYFDLGSERLVSPPFPARPPGETMVYNFTTTGVILRAGVNKHF